MRKLVIVAAVLAPLLARADGPPRRVLDTDQRSLSAEQIQHYAADYLPGIRSCYLRHGRPAPRATGELALRLVVHRNGEVEQVAVDAPGVTGKRAAALLRCVREQVDAWHFPVRRDFTTAILPYYFLRLDVRGAGPQRSCWSPRGCPTPVVVRPPDV